MATNITINIDQELSDDSKAWLEERLSAMTAPITEQLVALGEKVQALQDAVTDYASDVAVIIEWWNTQRGRFSPDEQSQMDAIVQSLTATSQKVADLDAAAGDNDGSDGQPPAEEPVLP